MSMSVTSSTPSVFNETDRRTALGLEFSLSGTKGSWKPELSEEEQAAAEAQPLTAPRQLTEEEQNRVEFLQDQLETLLQELAENPSEEKRARIREIESELEEITGVKTGGRLSKMAAKLPSEEDEEEESEDQDSQSLHMAPNPATLAEELAAQTLPEGGSGPQPGIPGPGLMSQMLKAAGAYQSMSQLGTGSLSETSLQAKA